MKLRRVGEDRLLERLLPLLPVQNRDVVAAAGDDCAVVRYAGGCDLLVLKTDCVVEAVHFESAADPRDIGWKAMMRPLSDFAAISGLPRFALITLIVPAARSSEWVTTLYRGINRAARKFGVSVVGGETSSSAGPAIVSVSVAGIVEQKRWVGRRGGKMGDDLFVTGRLGGSIRGRHLRFVPRIVESRWLTEHFRVHAMMDLSDGLGADLPRLARASKVGFEIQMESLPLSRGSTAAHAVSDGEDYELLFAISPRDRERVISSWKKKFPRVPLTRIGKLVSRSARRGSKLPHGYVHFR